MGSVYLREYKQHGIDIYHGLLLRKNNVFSHVTIMLSYARLSVCSDGMRMVTMEGGKHVLAQNDQKKTIHYILESATLDE